ncbi:MAG: Trm112 family protein [Desulfuromonadaceae bacterium]|nr:Trm112 family protein [Desulfuromonadaceae bacterium]
MSHNMDIKSEASTAVPMSVPVELLACARCKGVLVAQSVDGQHYLNCTACKLAYPIRDGIPRMLQDEAVSF